MIEMTGTQLLSTAEVAAQAARLSMVNAAAYAQDAAFPVVHAMKQSVHCDYLETDSPASAIAAAVGMASVEKRAIVIASQPDTHALQEAAYARLPVVVFSPSHPESISALRDAGCLLVSCESHQELADTVIRAFALCESSKVLLPAVVSWDGPLNYSEPLALPSDQAVKSFLPQLRLPHKLDPKRPSHITGSAGDGHVQAKQHVQKAMDAALRVAAELDGKWKKKFRRSWQSIEKHHADDADLLLVMHGYHSATAKAAVDALRSQGKKAGLVRLRLLRPLPRHALSVLAGKRVAVLDFAFSPGSGSPLYHEIKPLSAFALGFVAGRYLSEKDFLHIFSALEKAEKEEMAWI